MHGRGFIAKQSSFLMWEGCFLKALGLQPLAFREGRVPTVGVAVVEEARTPGCHGEGMELPTSLPASEAVKELKLSGDFFLQWSQKFKNLFLISCAKYVEINNKNKNVMGASRWDFCWRIPWLSIAVEPFSFPKDVKHEKIHECCSTGVTRSPHHFIVQDLEQQPTVITARGEIRGPTIHGLLPLGVHTGGFTAHTGLFELDQL